MRSRPRDSHFTTDRLNSELSGRTVRGAAVTSTTQAIKFLAGIATTVVLARLLTPEDYGLVGMAAVVTGFIATFRDPGLSTAMVQRAEITHAQVSTLFWLNTALGAGITLVTILIAPLVAWFYSEPRLTAITIASAGAFLLGCPAVQHEALLRRQMRFVALAIVEVASLLGGAAVAVCLAWRGWGYWALIVNQLSATLFATTMMWLFCGWCPGGPVRGSGIRPMLAFGGNLTGFGVMNYCARNLDNLLIGRYWGAAQLGLYAKAYQLLLLPLDQLSTPITAVAVPALSRLTDSPERYRTAYQRMLEKVALLTMPVTAFMIATSDWLVRLVLGPQWDAVSPIFSWLGVAGLLQPVAGTTGWLFLSQGRAHHMFRWGLVGCTVTVGAIVLGVPWGAIGVAAAYSVTNICVIVPLVVWFACRVGPVGPGQFYRMIGPSALASVSIFLALSLLRRTIDIANPVIGLTTALGVTVGIGTTVLLLVPAGRAALQDVAKAIAIAFSRPDSTTTC